MADFNPAMLRRVLMLRQFPLLSVAGLDELATVAENLVESYYPPGAIVARSNWRAPNIQLIIDGRIESNGHAWGPRQVFGALEVFAGRPVSTTAIAKEPTRCLELGAHEIAELLEDNFGLLVSTLRELASRMLPLAPKAPRLPAIDKLGAPLGLVERLILLRQQRPFAQARLQALSMLANTSDELLFTAGSVLVAEGEPATDGYIILEGSLKTSRGDVIGPGTQVGQLETLANAKYTMTVETTTPVRALRSSGTAMLDMLEDHTDIGIAMIASFARALLDAASHLN